jgi:hypothetical protein
VTFVEQLTAEKLTPVIQKPALPVQKPAAGGQMPEAGQPTATVAGEKPDAGLQVPSAAGQKPDVAGQKPDVAGQKPDVAGQKPDVAGQKPDAAGQKPDAAAATPQPDLVATPPAAPPVPTGIATLPTRIYAIRAVSRSGRPGPASARVIVPLAASVAPPSAVAAQMPTAAAVVVDWTPPVAEAGMPPLSFNVYRREAAGTPINPSPVADVKFDIVGAEYGKELCYVVRTVQAFDTVTLESAPSAPACLTPVDKFPPEAPKGLRAVAEDIAVSLVWDQNSDRDLGGYLVLRADAPDGTLLPLTKQPIADANYRDATVKPGVRYVYAVVAVDTATPMNRSAPSAREEVTAR